MRISDLISLGSRYLLLGIILAAFIAVSTIIIYRFFLKKRNIPIGKVLLWAVFICYIIVVLGVTLMMRASFYEGRKIMPLFYSYREAWVDFSAVMWRNIILNILMFVPFGFLLPICHRKFDSFWETTAAAFIFTGLIETVQYFLKLGIFEPDDLLNNTIGAMIGFGIYTLVFFKKRPIKRVLALQIPIFITILAFAAIFITYYSQPVGNIEGQFVIPIGTEKLLVTGNEYSDEEIILPVYKAPVLTVAETQAFAEKFFENIGTSLDESQNDIYDGVAVYKAVDRYSIWVDYLGGSYNFTDFDTSFSDNKFKIIENADENEIKAALTLYGITIPDNADFENNGDGRYTFTAQSGTLTCEYYDNGCFANIHNNIVDLEPYMDMAAISENEAFEMIKQGKFRYYRDEKLNIEVGECKIGYVIDSKGFYQPTYNFNCMINNQATTIAIAAIQ